MDETASILVNALAIGELHSRIVPRALCHKFMNESTLSPESIGSLWAFDHEMLSSGEYLMRDLIVLPNWRELAPLLIKPLFDQENCDKRSNSPLLCNQHESGALISTDLV